MKGFSRQGCRRTGNCTAPPMGRGVPVCPAPAHPRPCSQNPETRKQQALARGNSHLEARQPAEAIIALQNALQVDPQFVPALYGLARAYAARYWYLDALRELERARQLAPSRCPSPSTSDGSWSRRGTGRAPKPRLRASCPANQTTARRSTSRPPHSSARARSTRDFACSRACPVGRAFPRRSSRAPRPCSASTGPSRRIRSCEERSPATRKTRAAWPPPPSSASRARSTRRRRSSSCARAIAIPRIRRSGSASPRRGLARAASPRRSRSSRRYRPGPELVRVVRALARYYLDSRRTGDAIALLGPLVSQYPRYGQARFLLAVAYLTNEDPDRARVELEVLDRQLPGDPTVQFYLAGAFLKLDRAGDALARLIPLAKALDRDPEYHLARGRALAALGRLDEAQRAAETALRTAPQAPQAYVLLGEIRAKRGDAAGAREMLTRAASGAARVRARASRPGPAAPGPARPASGASRVRGRARGGAAVPAGRADEGDDPGPGEADRQRHRVRRRHHPVGAAGARVSRPPRRALHDRSPVGSGERGVPPGARGRSPERGRAAGAGERRRGPGVPG